MKRAEHKNILTAAVVLAFLVGYVVGLVFHWVITL